MKGSVKMIDFSGYESPIKFIQGEIEMKIEEDICRAVQNVGVEVDKEELLKALEYDRGQFEKGFDCGYKRAIDDVISKCSKEYQVWSNDSVCKIWLSDLVELKVKHEKGQGTEL